ncbi:hypothetical protein [Streptomyces sp. NPDC020681]|uniref:hypothetical protein n=1 Tax=Streptomyces sp. NPDC020681 TaxID=3365083 RepID=UPI0037AA9F14
MTTKAEARSPEVATEDIQRLTRLSEEIRSRLAEIALITARAAGAEPLKGPVHKYVSRDGARKPGVRADAGSGDWVEIIDVDGFEACYGVIGGKAFAESPCGAALM